MDKRIQAQMAKMDQQQELLLARLLTEEAQQLTERAKSALQDVLVSPATPSTAKGVTAYLERPAKRLRPNQRFLANTLGNICSGMCACMTHLSHTVHAANKRAEEDELWEQRRLQKAREAQPSRRDARSPPATSSTSSTTSNEEGPQEGPPEGPAQGLEEGAVQSWLAARRVRGRGGVGSLADEVGPFVEEAEGVQVRAEGGAVKGTEGVASVARAASPEARPKKQKKKKKKKDADKKKKKKKKRRRRSPSPD